MNDEQLKDFVNKKFILRDFKSGDIVVRESVNEGTHPRIPIGSVGRVDWVSKKDDRIRVVILNGQSTITSKGCFRHATVDEVNIYE